MGTIFRGCRRRFIDCIGFLFLCLFLTGCCSLALVDCGPKIRRINLQPQLIDIHQGPVISAEVKAWVFQNRDETEHAVELEAIFKLNKQTSLQIEPSQVFFRFDGLIEPAEKVNLRKEEENADALYISYSLVSKPFNKKARLTLVSLPVITAIHAADTTIVSLSLTVGQ